MPYYHRVCRRRSLVVVHHKVRQSHISRTVRLIITQFYVDINTNLRYIHTEYDAANYFRPEVSVKKPSKMPPLTGSDEISRERFKRGSLSFTQEFGKTGPTDLPDMTLLATSGQHLSKFDKRQEMLHPTVLC